MAQNHDVELTNRSKGSMEERVQAVPDQKEGGGRLHSETNLPPAQKLDRYINFLPTIAFGANLLATWESVAVSYQAGLLNGGPTSLIYGSLLCWIGSTAIAASLAEMASINPTVGAQYRWTALYAPPGIMSPAFWGLLQGWITVFAWIAVCALPAFLIGTQIQGLLILVDASYAPQKYQGTLLAWAILAIPVFCNIFARKALAPLEIIGGITHITFFIVWLVVLVVMAPRSTPSFVFTETITGLSGWSNPGVQWCIGLLSAAFPLGGFDGVLHMSDEVKDAERKVPLSMIWSVVLNGIMSFAFMIVILFTLGDLNQAIEVTAAGGYPIIYSLYGATGSKAGTIVLMVMVMWNGVIAMFSSMASVSRLTWAFARDKGLPFSDFFGYVHPTLRIPLNALGLVALVIACLQLVNLGSSTAFFAIVSLSSVALMISYILPILFITMWKLRGAHIPYGPIKLGRWGLPINLFALCYGIFVATWFPFPPYLPVTASNMNYGGPVVGGVILLALIDWFTFGKKRFTPPVEKHTNFD